MNAENSGGCRRRSRCRRSSGGRSSSNNNTREFKSSFGDPKRFTTCFTAKEKHATLKYPYNYTNTNIFIHTVAIVFSLC